MSFKFELDTSVLYLHAIHTYFHSQCGMFGFRFANAALNSVLTILVNRQWPCHKIQPQCFPSFVCAQLAPSS